MNIKALFSWLIVLTFSAASAAAEPVLPIVQAGPLVYADTAGHLFVVAVRGASESGLFVVYSPSGIPVQQFSPEQLPADAVLLFLAHDPQRNAYKKVVISEEHTYAIQGSFRIRLGPDSWMGVDTFNNPYCSFVLERAGQKPTILGFVGTEKVVLAQGEKPVALLAATQSLESYKSFVDEYQLSPNGLLLKNVPLVAPQIGIQVLSNNKCFSSESVLLNREELKRLQAADPQKKSAVLEEARVKNRQVLESLIPVKITDTEITGYQPDTEVFYFVEKLGMKERETTLCLYSSADL